MTDVDDGDEYITRREAEQLVEERLSELKRQLDQRPGGDA